MGLSLCVIVNYLIDTLVVEEHLRILLLEQGSNDFHNLPRWFSIVLQSELLNLLLVLISGAAELLAPGVVVVVVQLSGRGVHHCTQLFPELGAVWSCYMELIQNKCLHGFWYWSIQHESYQFAKIVSKLHSEVHWCEVKPKKILIHNTNFASYNDYNNYGTNKNKSQIRWIQLKTILV